MLVYGECECFVMQMLFSSVHNVYLIPVCVCIYTIMHKHYEHLACSWICDKKIQYNNY